MVDIKPEWPKGYSRLGAANAGLGNWDDAVEAYKRGVPLQKFLHVTPASIWKANTKLIVLQASSWIHRVRLQKRLWRIRLRGGPMPAAVAQVASAVAFLVQTSWAGLQWTHRRGPCWVTRSS